MATDVVLTRWDTERSTHETVVRDAHGPAVAAVRGYVGYEEWPMEPMARREVARVGLALILAFGDPLDVREDVIGPATSMGAFVVGNHSHASLTELAGHQHGVQLELSSAGALALFGVVGDLNNSVVPIDEALGRWGTHLVEQLGNVSTWEERFELLDSAFAALEPIEQGDARLYPEVAWLRRQLVTSGGQSRVEPLMDETGWSRRLVTERFRSQLGVSPKAYARVVRFTRAVSMLDSVRAGRSLADVAIECGYYDQSHFTRDFSAMAGCSPTVFMDETSGQPGVRFLQDDDGIDSLP